MSTALFRGSARLARSRLVTRCFCSSIPARKDLVQDLYLNELRTYKPPPPAKDAHVGVVKPFTAPSTPTPPASPTDLATELSAYDASEPTTVSASPKEVVADEVGTGATEFLAFLEQDLPKPEHHHH